MCPLQVWTAVSRLVLLSVTWSSVSCCCMELLSDTTATHTDAPCCRSTWLMSTRPSLACWVKTSHSVAVKEHLSHLAHLSVSLCASIFEVSAKLDKALEALQLCLKLLPQNSREELHRLLTFMSLAADPQQIKVEKEVRAYLENTFLELI